MIDEMAYADYTVKRNSFKCRNQNFIVLRSVTFFTFSDDIINNSRLEINS